MHKNPFLPMFQGTDRRSIGKSNQVVTKILRQPNLFPKLIELLWHDDVIVRMRAADPTEKISIQNPGLLQPHKSELLSLASEATQQELRWHLALMLPRLELNSTERTRAIATLRTYLSDRSSIVKTFALQALTDLAQGDPTFESEILDLLEQSTRTGTPAMKARARKLLTQLQTKSTPTKHKRPSKRL
jgi:hypothetical protein